MDKQDCANTFGTKTGSVLVFNVPTLQNAPNYSIGQLTNPSSENTELLPSVMRAKISVIITSFHRKNLNHSLHTP